MAGTGTFCLGWYPLPASPRLDTPYCAFVCVSSQTRSHAACMRQSSIVRSHGGRVRCEGCRVLLATSLADASSAQKDVLQERSPPPSAQCFSQALTTVLQSRFQDHLHTGRLASCVWLYACFLSDNKTIFTSVGAPPALVPNSKPLVVASLVYVGLRHHQVILVGSRVVGSVCCGLQVNTIASHAVDIRTIGEHMKETFFVTLVLVWLRIGSVKTCRAKIM